ncbi:NB-ARC domain-containing protein [Reticulomyxa filosa]|uniref:NB-ARC domain-containing protein n=1 Tax=Reticulomyxa filosa TaxID=46433 RepID=X6MKM6_RETFI|nr:NB-ARC domain-containing protein [Reticulomyxa filosa]|eukprot:ETO14568.1 NB-ARC domain-containing protein [Reticulomyxa filosa]
MDEKSEQLKKEDEKADIGETKPGINLQGFCTNTDCLAAKARLAVWVNMGFGNISFNSEQTSYRCPDCGQPAVTSIAKAMILNSEHWISSSDNPIPVNDKHYQCLYAIKVGLSYEIKAQKIRQHATSLEDLITRSEHAMTSNEIINLVCELQKYLITVVKPPKIKDRVRLLEKIKCDYGGDYNQVFDIGRFTILCDNATKLQTAVAVMKKAEKFHLIVSEDKDFFERQSKTHHRFHNIKLFVPKDDVYIEMQATLKNFTTLEGYTVIENPKLSHLFYEHIRAWKPKNSDIEEDFKQASDETLTKINDIICEWLEDKEIQKIANRYKSHFDIGILKPPQLSKKSELEMNDSVPLKMALFVYEQLCKFTPEKKKGKAIYVILYEYYKKYIIGDKSPASCVDFALLLQESRKQEIDEDIAISQALETYIPLQANNYPHIDGDDNEKNDSFDCHQHAIECLQQGEDDEKKHAYQQKVIIIQGKSGSGKSIFCRHLEETLWNNYISDSKKAIPVYISFPKVYNKKNERDIILQALQSKHINKDIMDAVREKVSFVFIMDGFDEIFDFYRKNENDMYFYDRFNLNQWNSKVIVTCRSKVLSDDDIKNALIGVNQNSTSLVYLWPFTKQQMHSYIDKFAKLKSKNMNKDDSSDWTSTKYEETLNNYPNLQKMIEEPFLLQLILSVLPSLVKQFGMGSRISKAQVYEAFNDQWIDIHSQNIISKLAELRIQMNIRNIKSTLRQYCLDLGLDMFIQGNQVAVESDFQYQNEDEIWSQSDPEIENEYENKSIVDEKQEIKTTDEITDTAITKVQDIWEKYFKGGSVAKFVLRRVGDNKYQFLHKSCQEYYVAQKMIFDILLWKSNTINENIAKQQQFETYVQQLFINRKLLNEEMGIIQFIAERIHDTNPIFVNLEPILFQIIGASKTNEHVSIAAANAITILNSANINMHYQDWSNIKIPHAILDHAFLEGTDFTNANLNNVRFVQACLNKVNFTNASMNEVYFGEYAYLEGHSGGILGIVFSSDGTKMLSYSSDGTIRIWDISLQKQIHLLEGHLHAVYEAQFSPDGSKVASCSQDCTIRLWDVSSGQQIQVWEEHSGFVNAAEFSPDGSKIVSCSRDKTIRIWEVSSGKQLLVLEGHSDWVSAVRFSSDSLNIVSSSKDNTIRIWDVLSGKQLQVLEGHSNYVRVAKFLSAGSKVISYSYDNTIRIWDASSGQQIQIFDRISAETNGIHVSQDESKILSYSNDNVIRIWDLPSGKQLHVLEGHSRSINAARFSRDGSKVVSGSDDRTVRIWDISSGKTLQILEGHLRRVTGVQFFSKDSKILSYSEDGTIRIWDIGLERKIQLTEQYLANIAAVKFSSDGSKIMSCSLDTTIRLWDVQSGKQIQIFEGHSHNVSGVLFSPDGSKIISHSEDKTIRICDALSGKQIQILEGDSEDIREIQSSPDGSKLVSYSNGETIQIWDVSSGKHIQLFHGHPYGINRVQLSPDGSKFTSCSSDDNFRLWDVSSGRQLQEFGHPDIVDKVQFSPDGSKIVSSYATDNILRVWDVSSGNQLLSLEGHLEKVNEAQFSPDGTQIVSCSDDKTIRIWDVLSEKQPQVLEGHSTSVHGVQFSPDGSKIISYSYDNNIRVWDVSLRQQIQLLEGHNSNIRGIQLSRDASKLMSFSNDKTIRLWSIGDSKTIGIGKCIWRSGVQSGLSITGSTWKDIIGLTPQQKRLVEQRGGTF